LSIEPSDCYKTSFQEVKGKERPRKIQADEGVFSRSSKKYHNGHKKAKKDAEIASNLAIISLNPNIL